MQRLFDSINEPCFCWEFKACGLALSIGLAAVLMQECYFGKSVTRYLSTISGLIYLLLKLAIGVSCDECCISRHAIRWYAWLATRNMLMRILRFITCCCCWCRKLFCHFICCWFRPKHFSTRIIILLSNWRLTECNKVGVVYLLPLFNITYS